MQLAFAHLLALTFAYAMVRYGWFMAHNPERALRLFTFGVGAAFGKKFFLSWSRGVGWFFTGFGCIAVAGSLVLLAVDLFAAVRQAGR